MSHYRMTLGGMLAAGTAASLAAVAVPTAGADNRATIERWRPATGRREPPRALGGAPRRRYGPRDGSGWRTLGVH